MKRYNLGKISDDKILKAFGLIRLNGGKIYTESGEFSIKGIKGRYYRENDNSIIEISDKPFFVSWGVIESELMKFFK